MKALFLIGLTFLMCSPAHAADNSCPERIVTGMIDGVVFLKNNKTLKLKTENSIKEVCSGPMIFEDNDLYYSADGATAAGHWVVDCFNPYQTAGYIMYRLSDGQKVECQ